MPRLSAQLEVTDSSSRGAHMAAADLVLYLSSSLLLLLIVFVVSEVSGHAVS